MDSKGRIEVIVWEDGIGKGMKGKKKAGGEVRLRYTEEEEKR